MQIVQEPKGLVGTSGNERGPMSRLTDASEHEASRPLAWAYKEYRLGSHEPEARCAFRLHGHDYLQLTSKQFG